MSKGLGSSESSIGRANRAGGSEDGAVSVEHHEGGILICQPAERRERHHPISSDYNETPKPVPNPRQAGFPTSGTDSVSKDEVTPIHEYSDPISEEGHDSMSWGERTRTVLVRIARLGELMYGLRSCHGSSCLLWWSGLAVC
jgi:hypothetical protein